MTPAEFSASPAPDGPALEASAEELYERAPCGYLSTRPDGTIVRINGTLLAWLGYEAAELVGVRTFQSLLTIGGRIYYETHYGPLLAMQRSVREIAVELVRRDGARLPALVNSDLHTDPAGMPCVIRTTVFDATYRRRYEQELLDARRAAEHTERRLGILQELVSDFAVALTRADVVSVLTGKALRVVRAARCAVWLVSDDRTALEWVDGIMPPADPGLRHIPLDSPLPHARAAREAVPVAMESVDAAAACPGGLAAAMRSAGLGSGVVVPLIGADEVLGVAGFGFREPGPPDAETARLVQTIGRQAGQTLQRSGLFDVEMQLRRRAETLQLITAALAVPLDARQIAAAAAERIRAAIEFDRVLFVLAAGPHPEVAVVDGFPEPVVAGWRADPAVLAPALAWPVTEGSFLDRSATGQAAGGDGLPAGFDGAVAVLPLRVGPVSLGTLLIGRPSTRGFPPGERSFLRTFAGQCAQALERARLHAGAVRRERDATFIVNLSRRLDQAAGLRRRAVDLVAGLVPAVAVRARVAMVGDDGHLEQIAVQPAGLDVEAALAAADLAATVDGSGGAAGDGAAGDGAAATGGGYGTGVVSEAVTAAVDLGAATMASDPRDGTCEVALPLRARGRVSGALVLTLADPASAHDRFRFFTELAESASLALENGRLYDQEHRNAHILQRGLLSGEPPYDPRVAITTWYRPATADLEVGGDWHDAFLVGPNRLAFVVGDVVGRGIRAAATMGQLRSAVRALAATDPGPAGLLDRLDRFVDRFEDGRMSTVAYGLLDLSTGKLRYACAGHVPPLLTDPGGRQRFLWDGRSTPIAAYAGMGPRVEAEEQLAPGSRVLLYTDGLVERRTGNLHTDLDRLATEAASRFRSPRAWLLPDLAAALAAVRDDDVCMLCLSFGSEPVFERRVAADVNRLKSVRDDLRGWLASVPVTGADADALLLGCSEAVANAMEHAYGNDGDGMIDVRAMSMPGSILLIVRDRGSWRPPGVPIPGAGPGVVAAGTGDGSATRLGDRGRGLMLIRALMSDVTVEHDGGTMVTMRRMLTPAGRPEGRQP